MSILFVHNALQPFVAMDLQILREQWPVIERYERSPKSLNPIDIARAVSRADLIFCWFASWHSFFPVLFARMLRKPTILVIGGYDTANVSISGYGLQRGIVRRWISRTTIRTR